MLMNDSLEQRVIENLDLILNALKIEYSETGSRFFFPCPIHASDNYNSMSLYKNSGRALCFTMNCTNDCHNIFDFVSKVLEKNPYDEKDGKKFCREVLSGIDHQVEQRKRVEKIDYRVKEIDRSLILPYVNPNVEFYLRRGYSREILEKYDIFICTKRGNFMYGRATIPIYNDDHTKAVGFLGRSLNPKCSTCNKYHKPTTNCPITPYEHIKSEKWLNSRGLARNKLLFNYWYAEEEIRKTKSVLLVESPGNTMKIVQAGYNNVLGIFGTALSKNQALKLDGLGVERVYLGLDRDPAGENALEKITQQLSKYETIPLIPPTNDYGDMSPSEIISFFDSQGLYL